jgi:cystathionine beta-lyase/cystathionine gamma-synthase
MEEKKRSLATRLAQSGTHDATTATRDLTPPIHLSTTYEVSNTHARFGLHAHPRDRPPQGGAWRRVG